MEITPQVRFRGMEPPPSAEMVIRGIASSTLHNAVTSLNLAGGARMAPFAVVKLA
ncbi:hypothetical protein [Mesorhizobium qingshengii]|jgi:hypothetical protein|uniref:Uncharacterized protein n=1 Tax=Mesorhizobium qingshengii TaxID=1165689 RepID=A0A1G5UYE7_9HYPH|nr:hypothetical protein [Mesorhizobium qingshengii]SDA38629.1 hypothetical protein SAMN02927914_00054 [Mesorhizobium qingshengii]